MPINNDAAARAERDRISAILDLGSRYNEQPLADRAIQAGTPLDQFRGLLFSKNQRGPLTLADLGLDRREQKRYSVLKAIMSMAEPQKFDGGLEREVSNEIARRTGRVARGLFVPDGLSMRDLTTSTASGTAKAGNTVATDLLPASFVDVLRNKLVLNEVGASFLTGLQGNVAIPRKTAAANTYWVAENSAPTESSNAPAFDQITLSPKTVGGYVDFSRRLMLQSSLDIENLVRNDLASTIAAAMDSAALSGSGSNRPTGVLNTSGIGSVTLGTNGGAPTWAMIVNLVKEVEIDNALAGRPAFVTSANVRAKLSQTAKQSSGVEGNFILGEGNASLYGYPLVVTNAMPSNLSKGSGSNLSAMIFGDWSSLMIGQWSGIDLLTDPFTNSSTGAIRVTAFHDCDFAVRHPESFAECNEIVTT
jgi:HK97 family phage major capsid protein